MSNPDDPKSRSRVHIVDEDRGVVELALTTSRGQITVITDMEKSGESLVLKGLHIGGPGAGTVGIRDLLDIAREFGRQQGVKKVTIYGGMRTTGANPGHVPRPITIDVEGK